MAEAGKALHSSLKKVAVTVGARQADIGKFAIL